MVSRKWSIRVAAVLLSLSLALVGCGTSNSKTAGTTADSASGGKVTIRFNMGDGEITKDQIAEFNKDHPNINLERVDTDFNKLMGMIAANSEITPDIIRLMGASEFPFYASRGLALDLEPNFKTSALFKADDLLEVSNIYRWDGQKPGSGDIYGFVKDWSPDFNLFINKKLFAAAGIPIPSDKEPLTWDQVMDYSKKLTKKEGDKYVQWGLWNPFVGGVPVTQDVLLEQLASSGQTLYSSDNSHILLNTPEAKKDLQWWVDAVKAPAGPSALNSEALSWVDLFAQNKTGIMMAGYWFSGLLRGTDAAKSHLDDFMLLPSPMMTGGKRIEATESGTGGIIYSKTKHPKEAWTVFEWFFGAGKPSSDRAKSGWGLPGFKSKMDEIPTATAFDKQSAAVVKDDLKYLSVLPYNPYMSFSAIGAIFDKYMTPVYFGKDTTDSAVDKIMKEVDIQIKENKDIVGAK